MPDREFSEPFAISGLNKNHSKITLHSSLPSLALLPSLYFLPPANVLTPNSLSSVPGLAIHPFPFVFLPVGQQSTIPDCSQADGHAPPPYVHNNGTLSF